MRQPFTTFCIAALAAALPVALCAAPALAAGSVYTKVDFEVDCKQVSEDEVGGSWTCKGYGDYPVHFAESDLRQSAFYGPVGDWYEKGASETFGAFNYAGPTIEWRIENGRPFATIRRWFVSGAPDADGNPGPETQVLVVSRVAQPADGEGCVVAYVEATANPDANDLARRIADEQARDFRCRASEPAWAGMRRATDVQESRHFEEMAR